MNPPKRKEDDEQPEEESSEIEEPFGTQSNDLPLDAMVRTIEIELLGTLGKPTPPPIQAQDNNLL